ncbi:MAG TPA: hypothetical protein VK714_23330 [Myxococcota bacterium]|nr:hypothetical protein [Myxococcota bacterium]
MNGEEVALTSHRVARALSALDRRAFLRLVGAVTAAGSWPLGCRPVTSELGPPPEAVLKQLTPRTYAVFQAAAGRLLGPGPAELIQRGVVNPAQIADAWLARLPELAPPLRAGLLVLEFTPFPLLRKLRPFTALSPAAQDGVLADLMHSSVDWKRTLFKGIKSFACLTFYSAAPSRAITRYPGPFGGRGGAGAIAQAMEEDD